MKFTFFKNNKIQNFIIQGLSKKVILLAFLVWVTNFFLVHPWTRQAVINHDIVSYYSYLPATFIYKDLSFEFSKYMPEDFKGRIWFLKAPNGARVQKMSMGLAFLYAPFFFLGHLMALLTKYNADGYTSPYELFIALSSIVYSIWALFLLRKLLLKYFNENITAITILIIALGTNHLHYVAEEGAMSHAYSFFLFIVFIRLTEKWHVDTSIRNSIYLGLIGGLITLVRPTNIIIFLIPALYGVYNKESVINKIQFIKNNILNILIVGVCTFLVFSPQMIYWKSITGDWLYYSYSEEGFFFNKPNIINGLFSYRKGWLIYTPLMIFAIIGIPMLFKKLKEYALGISIFLVFNIYIIFSWWCWWYGGGYGARPMIESYALLSLPLAVFIAWILQKKRLLKMAAIAIIFALISLNIFQNWQYRKTLIHWDSMTKEAYWGVFGKKHFPDNYQELVRSPEYAKAKKGEKEY